MKKGHNFELLDFEVMSRIIYMNLNIFSPILTFR